MTPGTPGDDDDDDDADDDDDTLSGGEASLGTIDVMGSPDNEDVEEGEEDVAVLGFEIEVEDADAMFERVDVQFEAASSTLEDEPWELLDEVSLWLGDDEIARVDASDEDEWEDVDADGYELRFTGLSEVVDEDETAEFYVAVSAAGNIDSEDLAQEFTVRIPNDGVRAVDGEGINHYEGDDAQDTTFGFEEEGTDEELDFSLSDDNPEEAVIMVEEDNTSDPYELLVFEMEAEGNDIEINELVIDLGLDTTDEFDQVVADAWLEIDGEEFNDFDETPSSGTSTSFALAFDIDGDVVVEEDDTVTVSFVVEFQETDGNYTPGLVVDASVNVDATEAEGADDLDDTQLTGSATGEDFTLMDDGIFADFVSEETDKNDAGTIGEFVLVFEVTAFEDDFFVPLTTARDTGTTGVVYQIEDGNGDAVATGTVSAALSSDAEDDGWVEIGDGDTEEFELSVFYDAAAAGTFRLQLLEINFNESASTTADGGMEAYIPSPAAEFDTGFENLAA
jgi:hypothetical protein